MHKIWKADDYFMVSSTQRIDMDPSVVNLPEEPIVVVWQYDWQSKPIARLENVRLEGDEIVGDLVMLDPVKGPQVEELYDAGDVRIGGYYKNVVFNSVVRAESSNVVSCDLVAAAFILNAGFPNTDNAGGPAYIPGSNPGARIE